MSDIGPQLPGDKEVSIGPVLPANFRSSSTNEVGVIGPILPSDMEDNTMVGPMLPPGLEKRIQPNEPTPIEPTSESSENIVEEESYGPSLPPELAASRAPSKPRRGPIGPQLPSGLVLNTPTEDDSTVGPMLPSSGVESNSDLSAKIREIEERAQRTKELTDAAGNPQKVERGEWMLVPPTSKTPGSDPLNLKTRQFAKNTTELDFDSSGWTETPADREKRLRKGKETKVKRKKDVNEDFEAAKLHEKERHIAKEVAEYNVTHRPKSLMDMHLENKAKKKRTLGIDEDDPTQRRFDRDRDLSIKTLDPKKQQELLERAGKLGSRFSRGNKGSFL
ncbi:hypothetical protein K7432_005905 [Basidiobolus ranarum]|uniref:DUF3752 domain-containing protein n=1 Tax=Basidiobolus ranarum TaxID=34480 RepID=A0ABR2W2G6_9FUNG